MPPDGNAKDTREWSSLPLSQWIIEAVHALGWNRPTPVQMSTIGRFMGHQDVVVEAVTGSGKTLAYLIPIIERLLRIDDLKKHHVAAIIISPTRELAVQLHSVLLSLLRFHEPSAVYLDPNQDTSNVPSLTTKVIRPQLLYGGTTTVAQDLSSFLKNSPNLLISTPGRLVELLSSPHVYCPQSSFEVLVLDEADRLLDLGFKDDLQKILSRLPKQRRTGLFSASVSEAVGEIVRVGLRNPVRIAVKVKGAGGEDKRTPASLQMTYLVTPASHKIPALISILDQLDPTPLRTIVYLSTCAAVDYFQHTLPAVLPSQFSLVPLHGKHPPNVRQKNFTKFIDALEPAVLLTTDVAARGLDIPQVDLVVQIDCPQDPKQFIHRAGRAGRAGRRGLSVVLLHPGSEEAYVQFLAVRKTPISLLQKPDIHITEDDATIVTSRMRDIVLMDRALFDLGSRAFVSWVKSYSKHQASSIFDIASLPWKDLADAWGLVRLPKMPELKNWNGDRSLGLDINMSEYAYRDKKREQARLDALEEAKNAGPYVPTEEQLRKKRERQAWSHKHDQEDVRDQRKEKRKRKREAERLAKMTPEELEKEKELQVLIQKVKRSKKDEEEEFNGFSD